MTAGKTIGMTTAAGDAGNTTTMATPNPLSPPKRMTINGNQTGRTIATGNPITNHHGTTNGKDVKNDVKMTPMNHHNATNSPEMKPGNEKPGTQKTIDHAKAQDQIQINPIQVHLIQTTLQSDWIPNSEIHHSLSIPSANPNPKTLS